MEIKLNLFHFGIVRKAGNMGKILKLRKVENPILTKECDEVDIKSINDDVIDIIEDLKISYTKI